MMFQEQTLNAQPRRRCLLRQEVPLLWFQCFRSPFPTDVSPTCSPTCLRLFPHPPCSLRPCPVHATGLSLCLQVLPLQEQTGFLPYPLLKTKSLIHCNSDDHSYLLCVLPVLAVCRILHIYQHAKSSQQLCKDDFYVADIVINMHKDYKLAPGHMALKGNVTI